MTNKNYIVKCHKCHNYYEVAQEDCRNVYWRGEFLRESYCPFCGAINQEKTGFVSSGGGKF